MKTTNLLNQKCRPLSGASAALSAVKIKKLLPQIPGWTHKDGEIRRTINFKNFYETIGFVNAVAYIANSEDHHPDLEAGYNKLVIRFSTHSVGGLSMNDFICAAKVNALKA